MPQHAPPPRLGYIGLGIMGHAMARNLQKAGHALTIYNRTPPDQKPALHELLDAGAVWAESPAQVAARSDIVFLNVTDTPDVEQVLFSVAGVAAGADEDVGCLVVDHSTISPTATIAFAERLRPYHITLLDAPVSGGDVGARNGTLSIMIGGPVDAIGIVLPLLQHVGNTITRVGDTGAGQACKSCNQLAVLANLLGVCEALKLADKLHLNPHIMIEALAGGAAQSWQLQNLGPRIANNDQAPGFKVKDALKDLRTVQQTAESMGLPTTLADMLIARYELLTDAQQQTLGTQALSLT